jgi:hypothetical protein
MMIEGYISEGEEDLKTIFAWGISSLLAFLKLVTWYRSGSEGPSKTNPGTQ